MLWILWDLEESWDLLQHLFYSEKLPLCKFDFVWFLFVWVCLWRFWFFNSLIEFFPIYDLGKWSLFHTTILKKQALKGYFQRNMTKPLIFDNWSTLITWFVNSKIFFSNSLKTRFKTPCRFLWQSRQFRSFFRINFQWLS